MMPAKNNPFHVGRPVRLDGFVGRWEQVQKMVDDLLNPGGHSHALIGGRRFGKSSFLLAVRDELIKQLAQADEDGNYVFPVIVSFKRQKPRSPEEVFALMLKALHRYLTSPLERKSLGITLEIELMETRLAAFIGTGERTCSFDSFSSMLEELLDRFMSQHGGLLNLVFLLDETEEILNQSWTDTVFGQLRSLIYEGALSNYIRCVLAGSSQITEVREQGSPLLNMLKMSYLVVLKERDSEHLIRRAQQVKPEFVHAILKQCDGHPYLVQYLMNYAWDDLVCGFMPSVADLTARFRYERLNDLIQWKNDLGEAGLLTYKMLLDAGTVLTELEIKRRVSNPEFIPHVGPALKNLCCHGLVAHDGSWSKYHVAGELFRDWFVEDIRPFLPAPLPRPPALPKDYVPSIQEKDPIIEVTFLNNRVFPTAYCHAIREEAAFPFVTCTIKNVGPYRTNMEAMVKVTIPGYSDPWHDTVHVDSNRSVTCTCLPKIRKDKILNLVEQTDAQCLVQVWRQEEMYGRFVHTKDYHIQLDAFTTALLATRMPDGTVDQDLADYLAVFVTPHHANVEKLVGEAAIILQKHQKPVSSGYQGAERRMADGRWMLDLAEARHISRRQAQAFFEVLKKHVHLVYTNAAENIGKLDGQDSQRVRPPFVSVAADLAQGQANCLDGSILFASMLENVGMEAVIVIIPQHAFVGWRIWKKPIGDESKEYDLKDYDFLETTWIASASFQSALEQGNRQYGEKKAQGYSTRSLFNPEGFMRIIDVAACRKKGIYPLDVVVRT